MTELASVEFRRNDRAAIAMSLCYAVALFHRTSFAGIEPALRAEFSLSASQSADLAALFFWSYLLALIPAGLLTDAFGARRMSILGSLVVGAGALIFSTATSFAMLALARVVIAAGSTAAFVAIMRFVAQAFPRHKATFSGRAILAGNLGAIASGVPLVLALALIVWRDVWVALTVISVMLAALLWLIVPRYESEPSHLTGPGERLRELSLLVRSPYAYIGILVLAGLAGACYAFGNLIGPGWLNERGIVGLAQGWLVTVLIAGYGIGAAFWGWIGDFEHRRTHALLVATCAAFVIWVSLSASDIRAMLPVTVMVFAAGFSCGAFTLVYPLMVERHPPSYAGGVIALVNCGIPLGAALLQSVSGRLSPAAAPWLLVAAGSVSVCGSLFLICDRRLHRQGADGGWSAFDPAQP